MTNEGVKSLYLWLSAAWPEKIRPGVDDTWKRAKLIEMYGTWKEYDDAEVMEAYQKWTEENSKFPTTHDIINEIKWARVQVVGERENEVLWSMDFIARDGTEWSFGSFKRSDFINHPRNREHLQPEEWERRFRVTRNRVLKEKFSRPLEPWQQKWADRIVEHLKKSAEERRRAAQ